MRNKDTKRHVTVINKNECQESFDTTIAHRKKMVKNGKKTAGNKKKGNKETKPATERRQIWETKLTMLTQRARPKWELKSCSQRGCPFSKEFSTSTELQLK